MYTKKIDYSKMTAEQIARADKVAREIESTSSSNSHLREERGQIEQDETMDEEDRYSGVIRSEADNLHISNNTKAPLNKVANSLPDGNPWKRGLKITAESTATEAPSKSIQLSNKQKQSSASKSTSPIENTAPKKSTDILKAPSPSVVEKEVSDSTPTTPNLPISAAPGLTANKQNFEISEQPIDPIPQVTSDISTVTVSDAVEDTVNSPLTDHSEETNTGTAKVPPKTDNEASSKLNPQAKEFKFNPNAKSFAPPVFIPGDDKSKVGINKPIPGMLPPRGFVASPPFSPFLPPDQQQQPIYAIYDQMNPGFINANPPFDNQPRVLPGGYPYGYPPGAEYMLMPNMGMPGMAPVDFGNGMMQPNPFMMAVPNQFGPPMIPQDPYMNPGMMMAQGVFPNQLMPYPNQMMPNNMGMPFSPQMKPGGEYRHHNDNRNNSGNRLILIYIINYCISLNKSSFIINYYIFNETDLVTGKAKEDNIITIPTPLSDNFLMDNQVVLLRVKEIIASQIVLIIA